MTPSIPVVLVVDDDESFRASIRALLQQTRHSVAEAASVEEGEAILGQRRVDVLIADIVMPGKLGFEIMSIGRRKYPALKILAVFTAGADVGHLRMARLCGADATIAKPFAAEHLQRSLRFLLRDRPVSFVEAEEEPALP